MIKFEYMLTPFAFPFYNHRSKDGGIITQRYFLVFGIVIARWSVFISR
jgi:hypothetical protein